CLGSGAGIGVRTWIPGGLAGATALPRGPIPVRAGQHASAGDVRVGPCSCRFHRGARAKAPCGARSEGNLGRSCGTAWVGTCGQRVNEPRGFRATVLERSLADRATSELEV